jgi:hypothetical protein
LHGLAAGRREADDHGADQHEKPGPAVMFSQSKIEAMRFSPLLTLGDQAQAAADYSARLAIFKRVAQPLDRG